MLEYNLLSLDFHYFQNIKEMQVIQKRAIEMIWGEGKILVRDVNLHLFR